MNNDFFIDHAGAKDEIFEDLKGYEEHYTISSKGYIISKKTDHIPETHLDHEGYTCVNVYSGNGNKIIKKMHTLVANTFLTKPITTERIDVDHINGIKSDPRLENLQYVTHSQNMKNAIKTGNSPGSKTMIVCKLNKDGNVIKRYNSIIAAATAHNLCSTSISGCCNNPDKHQTAGGFGWRFSRKNKEYVPELQDDEVFKKLFSKEHNLKFNQYEISNYGNIRIIATKKYMKPSKIGAYYCIKLTSNGKNIPVKIHRLVAFIFLDKPVNCNVVNHLDENKLNNYEGNLEWTTSQGNSIHSMGKPIYQLNLKTNKIIKKFNSISEAAREIGKPVPNIAACCNGRRNFAYGYKWKFA